MSTENISDIFTGKEIRCFGSWHWLKTDFAKDFQDIYRAGIDEENHRDEIVWHTRHKYTMKLTTPSGRVVAFKRYVKQKLSRRFGISPTSSEALNYQRMADLGFPMVKLLAVGDERKCFLQKTSFIITEYALDFLNGREFLPGHEFAGKSDWRDEFFRRNFELIAKLHDEGIYHRGFTPANELWKNRSTPDRDGNWLDIVWIDVATCRKLPAKELCKKIPDDLATFLKSFPFEGNDYRVFLQDYCNAAKVKRFDCEELCREVQLRLEEKRKG